MRVLVTRPLSGATRTAERLRALGHVPLVAPLMTVEPTGEPPPTERFDAILVTSANAIPALARLDATARALPIFAPGTRTARLLREAGLLNVREGGGDANGLAASLRRSFPPPGALLHVAGRDRKPEPKASLSAAGYQVAEWVAYAAVPASCLPARLRAALSRREIEAVLHYSHRSAAILRRLAERAGVLEALGASAQICLSPDVAEALPGAPSLVIASYPGEDAMMEALSQLDCR